MYRAVISVKLAATSPSGRKFHAFFYSAKAWGNEKGGDRYVLVVQRCHDALGCPSHVCYHGYRMDLVVDPDLCNHGGMVGCRTTRRSGNCVPYPWLRGCTWVLSRSVPPPPYSWECSSDLSPRLT